MAAMMQADLANEMKEKEIGLNLRLAPSAAPASIKQMPSTNRFDSKPTLKEREEAQEGRKDIANNPLMEAEKERQEFEDYIRFRQSWVDGIEGRGQSISRSSGALAPPSLNPIDKVRNQSLLSSLERELPRVAEDYDPANFNQIFGMYVERYKVFTQDMLQYWEEREKGRMGVLEARKMVKGTEDVVSVDRPKIWSKNRVEEGLEKEVDRMYTERMSLLKNE